MEIVVNEWLLDYLRPDAEPDQIELSIKFVNAWVEKSDRVIIRKTSPFTRKLYNYMDQCRGYQICLGRFRALNNLFRDSDKTRMLDDCDISEIPENLAAKTPTDDRYLVELWYSVPGSVIVTTDSKLRNKLIEYDSFAKIYLLEEFFRTYCSGS
jgi:hypothetical protein